LINLFLVTIQAWKAEATSLQCKICTRCQSFTHYKLSEKEYSQGSMIDTACISVCLLPCSFTLVGVWLAWCNR